MAKFIKFKGKELDANTRKAIASNVLIEGARPLLWWRKQANDTHQKFMREMRISMENGESVRQAATRITGGTIKGVQVPGIIDTSKRNANTLARTAINKVSNEARIRSFEENSDMIKAIKQISTLDNRTSQICIAYDGQVWANTKAKKPIPPSTLPFNGGPPRHFNCRSTLVPVLKSWKELGIDADELPASTRASMDGQVPDDTTFDDFLKSKDKAFQDKLLGPAKARLWRSGKINLQQLVDFRGNPLTVDQLVQKASAKRGKTVTIPQRISAAIDSAAKAQADAEEVLKDAKAKLRRTPRTRRNQSALKTARLSIEAAEESAATSKQALRQARRLNTVEAVRRQTAVAKQFSGAAELAAGAALSALLILEE